MTAIVIPNSLSAIAALATAEVRKLRADQVRLKPGHAPYQGCMKDPLAGLNYPGPKQETRRPATGSEMILARTGQRENIMKSNGFTLIELVVVIVILGILAAIAIPKYIDITGRAKLSADRAQLGALRSSTHLLYAQNILTNKSGGYWPTSNEVWANMTTTNVTWQSTNYLNNTPAGPTYDQSSGVWAMTNGGTE